MSVERDGGSLAIVYRMSHLQVAHLATLYADVVGTVAADDLAYTPELERIHAAISDRNPKPEFTQGEVYRAIVALRKRGVLRTRRREAEGDGSEREAEPNRGEGPALLPAAGGRQDGPPPRP